MRVALCQINPTIGALEGNTARIGDAIRRAESSGADLAVFPELAVCGYPPQDLLERAGFVDSIGQRVTSLASQAPPALSVLVGFVDQSGSGEKRKLWNAVALLRHGRIDQVIHKRLLPSYDVFDEDRYFEKGDTPTVIEIGGLKFGITICEDAWNDTEALFRSHYHENPVQECVERGAQVIVNIAASPFTLPKRTSRARMLSQIAARYQCPLVFVNQVGGNDSLIFDGSSAVFGPDGSVWARAKSFEEQLLVTELGPTANVTEDHETDEATALTALTLGTRDYLHKCGFKSAVLGLSGGVDSALVACIAARALGPENVLAISMPSRYSSAGSVRDAEAVAHALGILYHELSIDRIFQSYLDSLGPELEALGPAPHQDVTFENIQSRIRCATLMAISNRLGHLVLNTGNKSEAAAGYCTLYGDAVGGLSVIGDLTKNLVYRVAREVNRQAGRRVIPESILTKPPSAELRPNQVDEDSLPPYAILDAVLEQFIEQGKSVSEIIDGGIDAETVDRIASLVYKNEYKRRQMPPGLIVTSKAFGPGRRYPVAHAYRG